MAPDRGGSGEQNDVKRREFLYATAGMGVVSVGGTHSASIGLLGPTDGPQFEGGDGTEADPYLISTVDQLQSIDDDLDAHYRLTSDIDASDTLVWNEGAGFRPIGNEQSPFGGSLSGNGHVIRGLTIRRPAEDYVGVFGRTDDATVRNVGLLAADVTGRNRVGGLVGDFGAPTGRAAESGLLFRSSTSGTVTGTEYVGGLVGKNRGTVEECSSDSTTRGSVRVGGLVGGNQVASGIVNSYATGDVFGVEAVGGLFGGNQFATSITRSYATGRVSGERDVGGLVGHVDNSLISDSYWDVTTTGQDSSAGQSGQRPGNYRGLTTDQMTGDAASDYLAGFDFQGTWDETDGYPVLAWQQPSTPSAGGFDPAVHGFGFRNWAGRTGETADGEEFEYTPAEISVDEIEDVMSRSWDPSLSVGKIELLSRFTYAILGYASSITGHCYGMTHAAIQYYSNPSLLPNTVGSASEIPKPTGQYGAVGDLISYYQVSQLLSLPEWSILIGLIRRSIDTSTALEELTNAIDERGAVSVALSGGWASNHAVLAYGYQETDGVTEVFLYDTNASASYYEEYFQTASEYVESPTSPTKLRIDSETGELDTEYAPGGGSNTRYDRYAPSPVEMDDEFADVLIDHDGDVFDVFERALFVGLNSPARLSIDAPSDATVVELGNEDYEATGTGYRDAALVVDTSPGEYEIGVVGEGDGSYALEVVGVTGDEVVVHETTTGTVTAGEAHTYTARLPENPDTSGDLRLASDGGRTDDTGGMPSWVPVAGPGAIGGLGFGGYLYRRYSSRSQRGRRSEGGE